MKIVIDGRFYGLENAGLGRYTINLVHELAKLDLINEYFVLLRKKYLNLVLPKNWTPVLADFQHYSLTEQIKLPKIISSLKPDLVHFLHFNLPIFYRGPYVVTIHDLLMHRQRGLAATTLPKTEYFLKRLGYKIVFAHAVKKANQILVPSRVVKEELIAYYHLDPEKVLVTYEGVDKKITVKRSGFTKPYFLYVGNAYPHKNLKRLIEAIVFLNRGSSQKISLLIVSPRNVFTQRLEKIIENLNAKNLVKLLGQVGDKDLGALYQNSIAFVFPSLSEGFGLPGLEAMAAGTLVLASDIPVFKEIYQDVAIYFNPLDFSTIEKAMKDALEMDKEKRKKIIESGRKFVKRYSWSKMAQETLKVYKEVIKK